MQVGSLVVHIDDCDNKDAQVGTVLSISGNLALIDWGFDGIADALHHVKDLVVV